jgi:hypothetical protein
MYLIFVIIMKSGFINLWARMEHKINQNISTVGTLSKELDARALLDEILIENKFTTWKPRRLL